MKCVLCKGTMKKSKAPFHVERNAYVVTLQAVPAWVCSQCGEVYFDEKAVEAIQAMIRALDQEAEKVALSA
ncbi:MAG: type II toxin-antitoxin system MqsA family antitoxin [Acidobacteriota bacterium]